MVVVADDSLFPADFTGSCEDGGVTAVGGGAPQLGQEGCPINHRPALILALTRTLTGGHARLATLALDHCCCHLTLTAPVDGNVDVSYTHF